jgi:hypothetical protein
MLGKAQLGQQMVPEAITSFIKANDASEYVSVISATDMAGCHAELATYLVMCRKKVKEYAQRRRPHNPHNPRAEPHPAPCSSHRIGAVRAATGRTSTRRSSTRTPSRRNSRSSRSSSLPPTWAASRMSLSVAMPSRCTRRPRSSSTPSRISRASPLASCTWASTRRPSTLRARPTRHARGRRSTRRASSTRNSGAQRRAPLSSPQRTQGAWGCRFCELSCSNACFGRLAQICALHIIVNPDELEELIASYEKFGHFDE